MAWYQIVWPINQSVGQCCQIGQSVNWSMMPVNPVNGGLSRRATGSYGKCLSRKKKISRVIMNKREKSEDEQKRKEYKVVHVVAPVDGSQLEGGQE